MSDRIVKSAVLRAPHDRVWRAIVVDEVEPMRLVSFRWHPYGAEPGDPMTLVELALEEVPGGTQLTITESGFDQLPLARRAQAFTSNDGGWAAQLGLIAKFLAGYAG